jgi:hypothetical protein
MRREAFEEEEKNLEIELKEEKDEQLLKQKKSEEAEGEAQYSHMRDQHVQKASPEKDENFNQMHDEPLKETENEQKKGYVD